MGWFRPKRVVNGPGGTWEIYVSKTAVPTWRQGNEDDPYSEWMLVSLLVELLGFLVNCIVRPLAYVAYKLPVGYVRGKRTLAVRVEAVNPFPEREVLLWTTTVDAADRVVAEIADGLAAGKIVQPYGAVYTGKDSPSS